MKNTIKYLIGAFSLFMIIQSCQKVPLTGRKQLVGLVSSDQMIQMSYLLNTKRVMDSSRVVSPNKPDAQMINRVAGKIQRAAETYLSENNLSYLLEGYEWETKLVENDQVNAWCMPGGKICFYTGILPICKTESGVAVVMGHEVAHAIAEHGRERMSGALLANGVTQAGAIATGIATGNQELMNLAGQVLGVGTQLGGTLPNSRKQESEADKIGLIFMAMAGYNPTESVEFWKRMSAASAGSQGPPAMLRTHPTDETRIAGLEADMQKALKYYYAYGGK